MTVLFQLHENFILAVVSGSQLAIFLSRIWIRIIVIRIRKTAVIYCSGSNFKQFLSTSRICYLLVVVLFKFSNMSSYFRKQYAHMLYFP